MVTMNVGTWVLDLPGHDYLGTRKVFCSKHDNPLVGVGIAPETILCTYLSRPPVDVNSMA